MNAVTMQHHLMSYWQTWQEALDRDPSLRTAPILLSALSNILRPYRDHEQVSRLIPQIEAALAQKRCMDAVYHLIKLIVAILLLTPAQRPTASSSLAELGTALGQLVERKNRADGNAFAKSGDFLRLLYPDGLRPDQYDDALLLVRIFDKQMRIATAKDSFGESPYQDIAGYGLLGVAKDRAQAESGGDHQG